MARRLVRSGTVVCLSLWAKVGTAGVTGTLALRKWVRSVGVVKTNGWVASGDPLSGIGTGGVWRRK